MLERGRILSRVLELIVHVDGRPTVVSNEGTLDLAILECIDLGLPLGGSSLFCLLPSVQCLLVDSLLPRGLSKTLSLCQRRLLILLLSSLGSFHHSQCVVAPPVLFLQFRQRALFVCDRLPSRRRTYRPILLCRYPRCSLRLLLWSNGRGRGCGHGRLGPREVDFNSLAGSGSETCSEGVRGRLPLLSTFLPLSFAQFLLASIVIVCSIVVFF